MVSALPQPVVARETITTMDSGLLPQKQKAPFQILALDGGGFRGMFEAVVLSIWEQQLGHPITDHFDLIVGTSTGGIIALGLAAGLPASDLVDFYRIDGKEIFPSVWSPRRTFRGPLQYMLSKFGPGRLERALKARLPNVTMANLKKPVVITSFNLASGRHWFFKTPHFPDNLIDAHRPIWEVARATSAAPTYFPAFRSSRNELFIDGGLVANNPSLIGYFEVHVNFPAFKEDIKILNIGTEGGECPPHKWWLPRGGLLPWAKSAPGVLMQAQAVSTEALMGRLLGPDGWLRVKPEHGRDFAPLDVYDAALYEGIGATQAARFYNDANRVFFQHAARAGLVQQFSK